MGSAYVMTSTASNDMWGWLQVLSIWTRDPFESTIPTYVWQNGEDHEELQKQPVSRTLSNTRPSDYRTAGYCQPNLQSQASRNLERICVWVYQMKHICCQLASRIVKIVISAVVVFHFFNSNSGGCSPTGSTRHVGHQ
jgi:hypothetical protein